MALVRDPHCTLCKLSQGAEYVCLLGQGPQPCDIMVIGEAPGQREDDSGKPFVGRSGKYIDEVLEASGLPRKSVFITNAVSCRPPDNRTPKKSEIKACRHWLQYQIRKVKPKFILLLGNVPLFSVTEGVGIKKMRGKPFKKDGILYLPTYHPSYIIRGNYKDEAVFRSDVKLFKSLIDGGDLPREKNLKIRVIENEADFSLMLRALVGSVSFDLETTGLYQWARHIPPAEGEKRKKDPPDPRGYDFKITSVGFGTKDYQFVILPNEFKLTKSHLYRIGERLKHCEVSAHYGKYDALCMWVYYGVRWPIHFDTGIAHYLINENGRHDLKSLAVEYFDAPNWDVDNAIKHGQGSRDRLVLYHAHDLYYTRRLHLRFTRELRLDKRILAVFDEIMMPCSDIFVEAEHEGIHIDLSRMGEVETELKSKIAECERRLNKWGKINWGSPQQVGGILYKKLKIKCPARTPGGDESTSESTLKQIDHPAVKDLLDFRGAKQQLSFFIEGWKPYLVNSVIHPSFKLTGTVTGRLSCEHPNLQQVPRDRLIRTLVTAPPGWVLIEADLSQVELRIAAELSGDRALIEAFLTGKDPHWMTVMNELERGRGMKEKVLKTASVLKGKKVTDFDEGIEILREAGADKACEVDYEWKELRKKAKAVNFGYLYGMGWPKFKIYARDKYDVTLTDRQAQESRDAFFALYCDLPDWHVRQRRYANRNGFVRTLSGRKRRLPAAMLEGRSGEKAEAERQAINSPVQSFANELNLMALIQLSGEFSRDIYRPVGTVHDSILAIVRPEHAERVAKRTREVMCKPDLLKKLGIKMKIPLEAEVSIGPWGKGEKVDKWLKTYSRSHKVRSRHTEGASTPITYGTSKSSGGSTNRVHSSSGVSFTPSRKLTPIIKTRAKQLVA